MARPFMDGYRTYDTSRGFGTARQWRGAFNATMGGEEAARIVNAGTRTPYDILGIDRTASLAQVKDAYRAQALACHPDRCAVHGLTEAEATEQFKAVLAAYTILSDPATRRAYDEGTDRRRRRRQ